MPVNLTAPAANSLYPVKGVQLGFAKAQIRKPDRKDLLVIKLVEGCRVAGVFTKNRFCAAPVTLCQQFLAKENNPIRALLVNTGNANAGTGEQGMANAVQTCEVLSELLNLEPSQVLPFSTGVILEPLPVERIVAGLPACIENLTEDNWLNAAEAIMTTDIVAKGVSRKLNIGGKEVTITGIAKGSGMIHPNMATMLGYIATDAAITQAALNIIIHHAVNRSFNCITVDGDTSTNDSLIMMATNQAENAEIQHAEINEDNADFIVLRDALTEVATTLAQAIVRDGEGATKLLTVSVDRSRDDVQAKRVAKSIVNSPLVKTAVHGADPNWGRVAMAIGKCEGDSDISPDRVVIRFGTQEVYPTQVDALGLERLATYMSGAEVTIGVSLMTGNASATVYGCDLSAGYVQINGEYTT